MKVFALRMVPIAIGGARWQKEVRGHVAEVLYHMESPSCSCELQHVGNYCHNTPLPKGDGTMLSHWGDGRVRLCDLVDAYCWENHLQTEKEDREGNCRVEGSKTGDALQCCIRAACDVATGGEIGVLGYSVGDIRRMWKGRPLPGWVTAYWEANINTAPEDALVCL